MFTISRTFTRITLAAAVSLAFAGTANAQTIRGDTVVGGFAKNGGAVQAHQLQINANQTIGDDVANAKHKFAHRKVQIGHGKTVTNAKVTSLKPTTSTNSANRIVGEFAQRPGAAEALKNGQKAQTNWAETRMKALSKNTQKVLNGNTSAAQKVRAKGNAAKQIRTNAKMRQMFNQKLASGQKGILKKPGTLTKGAKQVKFNLKPLAKGAKYGPSHVKTKLVKLPGTLKNAKKIKALHKVQKTAKVVKHAKTAKNLTKLHKTAKLAKNANNIRKGVKAANTARKVGKVAMVGTGVGAVVVGAGLLAGVAGVDPVDLALLKATDPAAYNAKMAALKKNPMKYMGNNLKDNTVKGLTNVGNATIKTGQAIGKATKNVGNATKKAAANVGKATKTGANKVGCGVGNVFKKKGDKKKC